MSIVLRHLAWFGIELCFVGLLFVRTACEDRGPTAGDSGVHACKEESELSFDASGPRISSHVVAASGDEMVLSVRASELRSPLCADEKKNITVPYSLCAYGLRRT